MRRPRAAALTFQPHVDANAARLVQLRQFQRVFLRRPLVQLEPSGGSLQFPGRGLSQVNPVSEQLILAVRFFVFSLSTSLGRFLLARRGGLGFALCVFEFAIDDLFHASGVDHVDCRIIDHERR